MTASRPLSSGLAGNWGLTCGFSVGARGFEPRTSSVSRNSRHAIYQHKRGLTCGDAFVVVRHLLVVALCFAGFPRDGGPTQAPLVMSAGEDRSGHPEVRWPLTWSVTLQLALGTPAP